MSRHRSTQLLIKYDQKEYLLIELVVREGETGGVHLRRGYRAPGNKEILKNRHFHEPRTRVKLYK